MKFFICLKVYIFEDLLIFKCLILEIYSEYNWSYILNAVFNFGFSMLFKKWVKVKRKMIHFWGKLTEEKSKHCSLKRDSLSSEVEIRTEYVGIKM